jgi:hypothetical protein
MEFKFWLYKFITKMFDSTEASDATPLDPGGAVADFSASQGIMGDDQASQRSMSFDITVPLVGDRVACPVCEEKGINLFFMSLSDLNKHLDLHHTDARVKWSCLCGKSFPKLHGAQCHIPKCTGTGQKTVGKYKCEVCPMSFGTQRGLSTHERHAHPALRNQKRRGTDPPNTKNWTEVELSLLRELNEKFKDHKYPNKEINKILTNKTLDQIKYQRKMQFMRDCSAASRPTREAAPNPLSLDGASSAITRATLERVRAHLPTPAALTNTDYSTYRLQLYTR